jgi:hypothetical protein
VTQYEDGLLVVGENAVTEPGKLLTAISRMRGQVIVLRQEGVDFAEFMGLDFIATDAESRNPDARFARAGLYAPAYDRALLDRGVVNYDSPGGTGAAYFETYTVPLHNALMPPNVSIVFGGYRPHHLPCVRYALADGNFLFCQLPLESHLGDDVRAMFILQRLIELSSARAPQSDGAIFTDHAETREALRAYGFRIADDPAAAKLSVVSQATYGQDPRLQSHRNVLIYGAGGSGTLDGRKVATKSSTGFITFLVSPTVPGLDHLASANFYRIVDGVINKEGGLKIPVPVLSLAKSERAVFGKRTKTRMRVFEEPGGDTVMAYYTQSGGQRWVYGFDAGESCVLATALSLARWLELPFALQTPRRVQDYYVVGAGDVTLDGNLTEWLFDGDQTLHNWRHAMALRFGTGAAACTFYAMEDTANLYVALDAPETRPLDLRCGSAQVRLTPKPDGSVEALADGRAIGGGKWRQANGRVTLEAAVPHLALNLGQKSPARLTCGDAAYPAEAGTFSLRLRQPRFGGDCPSGGEVTTSGESKIAVYVGQATATAVPATHPLFDKAMRVAITESPGKGWKIQLVARNDLKPIGQGDLLLAVFYARCVAPDGHLVANARFGQTQNQIADVPIDIHGQTWQRFYARARANQDYPVGNCAISLAVGTAQPGEYEFANLQIVNYGANCDTESIPPSGPSTP